MPLRHWLGSEEEIPRAKEGFVYWHGKIWGQEIAQRSPVFSCALWRYTMYLATVLDQNLRFRNSLSCVLGKGEGCVVYLCAVGMEEGEVGEYGEELFRCSLEPDCFLGLTDSCRTELGQ